MRSKWFVLIPALASLALSACDRDPTRTTPEPVEPVFGVLSAGPSHTCALAEGGVAYCWGFGAHGRLGVGDHQDRLSPAEVAGGLRFRSITAGARHTCAITDDGGLYCWGDIDHGQAGFHEVEPCGFTNGESGTPVTCAPRPVPVAPHLRFTAVAGGGEHTCALAVDGAVHCWGENRYGQLGDGTRTASAQPVAVAGGMRFAALTAGGAHTCGLVPEGAAYCWGLGDSGQLGTGSAPGAGEFRATPHEVSGGLRFEQIDAYGPLTCATTAEGEAYCWGSGWQNGRHQERWFAPVQMKAHSGFLSAVAVGHAHRCALTREGMVQCWGRSVFGELGTETSALVLEAVDAAPGMRFRSLTAAGNNTCAVTLAGEAMCWGAGHRGQLGDGRRESSAIPVLAMRHVADR